MDDVDDPIPPRRHVSEVGPLRTQAEVHHYWRALMGPLGFSFRRLWVQFLEADERPSPVLLEIDDIPEEPVERQVAALMGICADVRRDDDLGPLAVLLSRPGEGGVRGSDRRWGRALVAAARQAGVPLAPIHLANDDVVVPLTGDDLLATG